MVGTETLNLFQRSGWRPKTHSHCRINCEKLVEGWLRSRPSTFYYLLPSIMDIFNVGTSVEEDFEKNRIRLRQRNWTWYCVENLEIVNLQKC